MSRRVLVAAVLGALGVVVAWWILVFSPAGEDLDAERARLAEAEAQEVELRSTLARLEALEADGPAIEAELARLSGFVPDTPDLAGFIVAADELGVRSGIDWLSIAPSPPGPAAAGPSQIQMSIQIEGGFFQVLDYLNRLEELGRLVVVDAVAMSAGGQGEGEAAVGGAPGLSVSLTARMFTRAAPESVPAAPTIPDDPDDPDAATEPGSDVGDLTPADPSSPTDDPLEPGGVG